MATLTTSQFRKIKSLVRNNASYKATIESFNLDKPTWVALFQTVENYFVDAFNARPATSYKAAVEAVAGTMTNSQAQELFDIWYKGR